MINKPRNDALFRNYESVIAESKAKNHQKPSKSAVKEGESRRKVDNLMEQQRLNRELDLWA